MGRSMKFIAGGVLIVGAIAAAAIYAYWNEVCSDCLNGGQLYPLYGRAGRNHLHRGRGGLQATIAHVPKRARAGQWRRSGAG